jgi:O-antigen ligase
MTLSDKFQKTGIYALYLTCFTCFFSSALTAIFSVIMLVCWLASGSFKNIPLIIKENSMAFLGIVFCALLLIGMVYSPAPLEVSLDFFKKYRVLLFIPIVLSLTKGQPNMARNIVNALLLGYFLVLVNDFLVDFGLISMNKFAFVRYGGGFLVIFAYLVLQRAMLEKNRRFLWGGFFIAISYHIFFVLITRTGWLVFIALTVLFIVQYFTLKKQLILFLGALFLLTGVFQTSHSVRSRVDLTIQNLQNYDAAKLNSIDSVGVRLDWYQISIELIKKKPVFGYGTGAYEAAQRPLVEGTSTMSATDPHNEFLLTAVQIGLVGLSVLLSLFIDPLLRSFKLIRRKEVSQAFALQATALFLFTGCFLNSWLLSTIPSHIFAFLIVAFYPIREKGVDPVLGD